MPIGSAVSWEDHDVGRGTSSGLSGDSSGIGRLIARAGKGHNVLGQFLDSCRPLLHSIGKYRLDPRVAVQSGASEIVQQIPGEAVYDLPRFSGMAEAGLPRGLKYARFVNPRIARSQTPGGRYKMLKGRPSEGTVGSRSPGEALISGRSGVRRS